MLGLGCCRARTARAEARRGERLAVALLASWRIGPTRQAIIEFVGRTVGENGSAAVPEWRARQPWKAASEHEDGWFDSVLATPRAGDDTNIPMPARRGLESHAGNGIDDSATQAGVFLCGAHRPTPGCAFAKCAYAPVELPGYVAADRTECNRRTRAQRPLRCWRGVSDYGGAHHAAAVGRARRSADRRRLWPSYPLVVTRRRIV
jgi:hypothetical protein